MNPHVSVIVPIYNVEAYVAQCLQSLVSQSYANFEAICVDDGSTDRSLDVAREAVGDDARFRFFTQENAGQSVARNAALDLARGDYLLFLDSDDYYTPDALQRLVSTADAQELDLLYFAAHTFYETRDLAKSNPEPQDNRPNVAGVFTGQALYVELERTGAFRPSACMFMMRRALVEDMRLRFEEGIIHEDLLFTMMVAPYAQRAAFLNEPLYQRRMRAGSTMTSKHTARHIRGHLLASLRMEDWLHQNLGQLDDAFCDAFCHRLHHTWMLVAQDVRAVGADEVQALRDTLSREERVALNLHGIELAAALGEVLDSTTFKVGKTLMAVPTALKDRLSNRG